MATFTIDRIVNRQDWQESFGRMFSPSTAHRWRVSINNSTRMLGTKNVLIRDAKQSNDGTYEIFLPPSVEDGRRIGYLMAEALVRIRVGKLKGTNKALEAAFKQYGLDGETKAAQQLDTIIRNICAKLPEYSQFHAALNDEEVKKAKDGTRLLKLVCDCGMIVRASRGACEEHGLPEHCGHDMEVAA